MNSKAAEGQLAGQMPGRVPPGPRRIPPLQDLRALQQSPLVAMQRIAGTYGDLVRYPLGPMTVYLAPATAAGPTRLPKGDEAGSRRAPTI